MRIRLHIIAILLLLTAAGRAAAGLAGAGSDNGAWLALSTSDGRSMLVEVLASGEPGELRMHSHISTLPEAMAAGASEVIWVTPPLRNADGPLVRTVRTLRPLRAGNAMLAERGALPPLSSERHIAGLVAADGQLAALLRPEELGFSRSTMLQLRGMEWAPVDLPPNVDESRRWTLLATQGAHAILVHGETAERSRLWKLGAAGGWTEHLLSVAPDVEQVVLVQGQVLGLRRGSSASELVIESIRPEVALELATIADVPGGYIATACGDSLLLAWEDRDADTGVRIMLLSTGGRELYAGPGQQVQPVSPAEFRLLMLMLVSIFLTALLFVLRPQSAETVASLPEDAALAGPLRRILASLIDVAPGAAIAWFVWGRGFEPSQDVLLWLAEDGAAPLLVVGGAMALHSIIGEAFTGRTLGKALTGCRTIDRSGGRPAVAQCVARNVVKVLCPALILFVLLAPYVPHPGSFETLVVKRRGPVPGDDGP
jgi:uncharacterized RDD family membrane protein YckC